MDDPIPPYEEDGDSEFFRIASVHVGVRMLDDSPVLVLKLWGQCGHCDNEHETPDFIFAKQLGTDLALDIQKFLVAAERATDPSLPPPSGKCWGCDRQLHGTMIQREWCLECLPNVTEP